MCIETFYSIPNINVATVHTSASKSCFRRFVITEKAPTRAFSLLKAATTAFNQEKALVGAFSVITNLRMDLFEALEEVLQRRQIFLVFNNILSQVIVLLLSLLICLKPRELSFSQLPAVTNL